MVFGSYETRLAEKGLDAAWFKMQVASHNISNYSTPGFKAKKVEFREALNNAVYGLDNRNRRFLAKVWTDEETEARVDGNNVSMEKEQLDLWNAQLQFYFLADKQTGFYNSMRDVIKNFGR